MKKILLFIAFAALSLNVMAYTPAAGDTNKVDSQNRKQGIWKENIAFFDWYGNYVNGNKEGIWVMYNPGNILGAMDEYKNGKKNGLSLSIDRSGNLLKEEHYVNDSLDGPARYYMSGGRVKSEAVYKNGKYNGVRKMFY